MRVAGVQGYPLDIMICPEKMVTAPQSLQVRSVGVRAKGQRRSFPRTDLRRAGVIYREGKSSCMARGGAPSWVYKQQQAAMSASYEDQVNRLRQRIGDLERENAALRKELEEYRKQLGK